MWLFSRTTFRRQPSARSYDCKNVCLVHCTKVCTWKLNVNRYLTSATPSIVPEASEHFQLSKLCLDQFCLPNFEAQLDEVNLATHIRKGDFAFFDYSIVNWVPHLLARIANFDKKSPLLDNDATDFVEILSNFFDIHWMKPQKKPRVPRKTVDAIKSLPQLEATHQAHLLQTIAASKALASLERQDLSSLETLKLYSVLRKVRSTLEKLAIDPSNHSWLEEFYGLCVFKCPRLYCKWFYEGFNSATKRDEHVGKHERSYYCPYIGCPHTILGFNTADDLEAHHQKYHKPLPTMDDFPLEPALVGILPTTTSRNSVPSVPAAPTPNGVATQASTPSLPTPRIPSPATTSTSAKRPGDNDIVPLQPPPKRPEPPTSFPCESCSKVFSKFSRLQSHQLTHSNEKPHKCKACGRAFARQRDCTRHELLHLEDRNFVCRGKLRDGRAWGCGKRFARAEGLARHFTGVAGKLCVKPLKDEEKIPVSQQNITHGNGATAGPTVGNHQTFPAAYDPNQAILGIDESIMMG